MHINRYVDLSQTEYLSLPLSLPDLEVCIAGLIKQLYRGMFAFIKVSPSPPFCLR